MTISEKVSYIKGLADGLALDNTTKEGKVLLAIIDVLNDMALSFEDIENELDDVADVINDMQDDIQCIEDEVYCDCGECDDDCCDDDECDCDDEDFDEDMYEVTCPVCNNSVTVDYDVIRHGVIPCPNCGEKLELDLAEIDEDFDEEDDD